MAEKVALVEEKIADGEKLS